jgi:cytochrome c biogenesis protein CcdA
VGTLVLSFGAGLLSALSPCVLPLLPIVVASALQAHVRGPLALAAGLVLSSTITGIFFAAFAFSTPVDRDLARAIAAALMGAAGIVLLVSPLQAAVARATAPLAGAAGALTTRLPPGLGGQFLLGALLGAVWTPCTGPTLAAAIALATRSESLTHAGTVMFVFGIGAVVPVLVIAYGSRRLALGRQASLATLMAVGKPVMGLLLVLVGVLALTGADKVAETWMVEHMPAWLVELTTAL